MSQCWGKMPQYRSKMSQCRGKMTQFVTTCPEQGIHTHVLVTIMAFYILNITNFNSMLCQEDSEPSQMSYESDYFCYVVQLT